MRFFNIFLVLVSLCLHQVLGDYSDLFYDDDLPSYSFNLPSELREEALKQYLEMVSRHNEDDIRVGSRDSTAGTEQRDEEHMEEGALGVQHPQFTSGGAGEGDQRLKPNGSIKNKNEVKSDAGLPFYCHPPNPCPKGFDPKKHNCDAHVRDVDKDQMAYIQKEMKDEKCTCDTDHMFTCPQSQFNPLMDFLYIKCISISCR
ncbi:unnamed protein product [Dimorphilus gyrociliatus]|uniref:Neuroendocrine protein 7B2 n=1 Tax=Dimorphilus gyrociliatus TaxID=2664684 RepID=A0A7I8W370_9ANNE|nr:unnamed protein product [Dimorphilus gyrociliatus]